MAGESFITSYWIVGHNVKRSTTRGRRKLWPEELLKPLPFSDPACPKKAVDRKCIWVTMFYTKIMAAYAFEISCLPSFYLQITFRCSPALPFDPSKNFFNLVFILHRSTVDLQCCVSFRCIAKWFSYTYTHIYYFSESFPIYVITDYRLEFPVLYSRSLLIIQFIYSSVYMSIPNC